MSDSTTRWTDCPGYVPCGRRISSVHHPGGAATRSRATAEATSGSPDATDRETVPTGSPGSGSRSAGTALQSIISFAITVPSARSTAAKGRRSVGSGRRSSQIAIITRRAAAAQRKYGGRRNQYTLATYRPWTGLGRGSFSAVGPNVRASELFRTAFQAGLPAGRGSGSGAHTGPRRLGGLGNEDLQSSLQGAQGGLESFNNQRVAHRWDVSLDANVVIGQHGDVDETHFELASQDGFRRLRHADHLPPPLGEPLALGSG